MSDPRESDPQRPPNHPGVEHHSGLAEEIREEIEHVVEHVPKPVRWTVRKIALLAAIAFVGLVVLLVVTAILYFMNRTELVAQELTVLLNSTLAQRSDVAIEIADIRGNPLSDLRLIRPRVRFRDGDAPVLLEAPWIRVKYSAWGLVSSRGRFLDIVVEKPVIHLARLPDGRLRLPLWKTAGPTKPPRGFDVRLRFHGATLQTAAPRRDFEGLDLDALISTGRATRVVLREGSWDQGPFATRDLKLSGELVSGDSVHFAIRRLKTRDVALTAEGGWKKGTTARWIHAEVGPLRWGWLAEATGSKSFDVTGQAERIVLDARGGEGVWNGRFTTRLIWSELPVRGEAGFAWSDGKLTLAPLAADSPAGNLRGRAAWSKRGWEIGGSAVKGDPSQWAAIGIRDWPQGNLNGEFLYAVDSRAPSSAHLGATLGNSEIQGWHADRAEVEVRFPPAGPDSFRVRMLRRGGEARLAGTSAEGGWQGTYTATNFPLDEWPEGRASGIRGIMSHGEGTVAGRSGELHVTGTLDGVATDWLGAHMARWRLEDVRGLLLPKPDFVASARLADVTFLGVHFDSAGTGIHLRDQTVVFDTLRAQAGDTLVALMGRSDWSTAGWHLVLDHAEARSGQFHWTAEPPVLLTGDREGVLFERLRARDGETALDISGRWAVPGGTHRWKAQVADLDLARTGMPDDWRLAGHADATLEIRGTAEEPRWTLEAECSKPGWQGHALDSLSFALAGGPARVEIRRGILRLDDGALSARGVVERTSRAWPESTTADAIQRWLATAERWDGAVEAQGLPLDRLERIAPAAKAWSGRVSGSVTIAGSPSHPDLVARLEAQPLAWQGYRVDDMKARMNYRGERLEVEELRMTRGNLISTVTGQMPLKLALGVRPEAPEREMSWRLEIPNGDLSVLPLFVQQVGSASGKFEMHASIGGTPRHPKLDGTLQVREGQLRPAGREEVLEDVYADCRLDESRVTLDTLWARQGERGRVSAHGVVELSGSGLKGYRFEVVMRDFTAAETGVYVAEFDGRFTVTDGPRVNGQVVPMVVGGMVLKRAVVLFDFANQTELQKMAASTQPLFWTYRVQVTATNNLRWQPPDGDIEFSANLTLEQTPERLTIDGEMVALRGTYYFLSNRFAIRKADLTFRSFDGVNPELDIDATTRVVPTGTAGYQLGGGGNRPETHTVTVRITGKSIEPVIEFASDPPDWDEATILRELTVGRFYAGGVPLGDPLDNYVTRAINKTLSAEMSRAFHGYISDWMLERERGGLWIGEGDLILGIGTQVTPNLLLRYRQRLPGLGREGSRTPATTTTDPFERDVEAEYRINRFFYITSELTQRRPLSGGTTAASGGPDFNVNLKARWEY